MNDTPNKRGPKSQTLIMIPLSELVAKLPAGSKVKLSRVWYSEIQETLGLVETPEQDTPINSIPATDSGTVIEDKILVESLDLTDE